ncbi:uncharacterized protein V1513DRAFT_452743 [Lipomyces chichibuensis]|uniref:uncharacterized protein n=1 Tax=Lipomyces chichibuensis TaxID=1546026 RepID=UPI003343760F
MNVMYKLIKLVDKLAILVYSFAFPGMNRLYKASPRMLLVTHLLFLYLIRLYLYITTK